MVTTCGIFLINKQDYTVLLCHPTNAPLLQWSIPKGEKGEYETSYDCVVRELEGETGIKIRKEDLIIELPFVKYSNKKKQLKSFIVFTDDLSLPNKLSCKELGDNKFPEVDLYLWTPFRLAYQFMHSTQVLALKFFIDTYKEYNF